MRCASDLWLSRPSCGNSGCVRARDRAHSSRPSRAAAESCRSRSPDPFRHFPTSDCLTAEASPGCAQARAFGLSGVLHTCILCLRPPWLRSEEHTSELQSLMRISYAVFCLKKKIHNSYELQHI